MARTSTTADKTLFIVFGDSHVLKRRATQALIEERLDEAEREFGLTRLNGREVDVAQIMAALSSGSLFAADQVVVVEGIDGRPKLEQQKLAKGLEGLSGSSTLIMTAGRPERGPADKPDLSAPLVKLVTSRGSIIACNTPDFLPWRDNLSPWIAEEAKRHGKRVTRQTVQTLLDIVGADADRLANELEKLAIYVGTADEITLEDVRAAAAPGEDQDIFGYTDALGERNAAAALAALPALLPPRSDTGEAIRVLSMVSRHLRLLWQARYLRGKRASLVSSKECPEDVAAKLPSEQNIFGAVQGKQPLARKYAEQAANYTDAELAKAMVAVSDADLALKGQSELSMDARTLLETLTVRLCRR